MTAFSKGRVEAGVGYVKKNFLAGLDIPDFRALNPAARQWLDSVANVRIHGETHKRPLDLFALERDQLRPLPELLYDIGAVHTVRASNRFRVTFDTNRYSVPAEYASQRLTLKSYPDRLCIYHHDRLLARHPRSYERHRDFEHPDHPRALLQQRRKATTQRLLQRFVCLTARADEYYRELEQRRLNPVHHVRKIVALSEIYGAESTARALDDAFHFGAFSSDYITNLLEARARSLPQPSALHLTRRAQQALGHAAVRADYDVLFTTQSQLLATLNAARAINAYERRFHTFARVPLLVIDDFGLKPLRAPQDEDFHDLVAERYEQGATIISSNLDFPEWGDAFPNRLLGAATLDRLRHGAYRLTLEGESYRSPRPMPEPRKPTIATGGKTKK